MYLSVKGLSAKVMGNPMLLPVSPAPAAPNREAMIAMPVAEPRTAAPPAPSTALAPAATKGAASPPVTPGKDTKSAVSTNNSQPVSTLTLNSSSVKLCVHIGF